MKERRFIGYSERIERTSDGKMYFACISGSFRARRCIVLCFPLSLDEENLAEVVPGLDSYVGNGEVVPVPGRYYPTRPLMRAVEKVVCGIMIDFSNMKLPEHGERFGDFVEQRSQTSLTGERMRRNIPEQILIHTASLQFCLDYVLSP